MTAVANPHLQVKCPTCKQPRWSRCVHRGEKVLWQHIDRQILAEQPHLGAPRRKLPVEARQLVAAGTPLREVARRTGIARSTLLRHGLGR